MKLAVVGAGWAGMAAAVTAAEAGVDVTVFEANRVLGGRARALTVSLPDGHRLTLDNGQHILIGAYREALGLMQTVGVDLPSALLQLPLGLPQPDGSGLQTPAWAAGWPAPLDALAAIATARGWTWGDRLGLLKASLGWRLRGFAARPGQTVSDLCWDLPPRVVDELIEPLCVSALNTPGDLASAQVFLTVLRDALFGRGHPGMGPSHLLLPRTDLSALLPETAAHWLQWEHAGHTRLHRGARISALQRRAGQWLLLGVQDGQLFEDAFDHLIWATAAGPAAQAMNQASALARESHDDRIARPLGDWARLAAALPYTAITTVYVLAPDQQLRAPLLALPSAPDAPAQFVFDRGQMQPRNPAAQGVMAFVVSASEGDRDTLQAAVLQQASEQLGLQRLRALQTVVEKRATFACTPGLVRPPTPIAPGLWAAGDYVEGPYPATLEGAVRSGSAAARAALDLPGARIG